MSATPIPYSFQTFSPLHLPALSYLNLRGNPLEQNSISDLRRILTGFPGLQSLEVTLLETNYRFSNGELYAIVKIDYHFEGSVMTMKI